MNFCVFNNSVSAFLCPLYNFRPLSVKTDRACDDLSVLSKKIVKNRAKIHIKSRFFVDFGNSVCYNKEKRYARTHA